MDNYFGTVPEQQKIKPPGKKRSLPRRIWRFCWKSAMWFFIITIAWVILYKWVNPPTTYLQIRESCNCKDGYTFHKDWNDDISLNMKMAVVASEDNNFMKHNGIDWGAVEKAKKYNETIGKKKGKYRGASTITQQTAKNVFLWQGSAKWTKWIRKGFEVYFTYLIEFFWSKERIMEVYLNVIETGPCKFGVEAAAQDFFKTNASKLSPDQAALIAASLPNPKKYIAGKPGKYLQKRQGQITRLMRMIGYSYFERYADGVPDEKRKKEEAEVEKKIQSVPESELPEKVEDVEEVVPVVEEPATEIEEEPVIENGGVGPVETPTDSVKVNDHQ
ncbi:MAG: monofunctional biosynthetic peptidoglycan transglycosylase [Flavobacteriales bacterium]|nr:monofunctional biosynthetic peptidoglycan transglycosylase [Flavobacteriales bacterium]